MEVREFVRDFCRRSTVFVFEMIGLRLLSLVEVVRGVVQFFLAQHCFVLDDCWVGDVASFWRSKQKKSLS